MAAPGPVAHR